MIFNEFNKRVSELASLNNIIFNVDEIEKLYKYMNLLLEWNNKMNLTAIIDINEIILKHFIDSAIVSKYIKNKGSLIDVGTGAGFPGIILNILDKNLDITLLDALNKRVNFLNTLINELKLENIIALHGRAEILGKDNSYREKFDIVVSRAVANMNVLLEYMLPLVRIDGICICMKSVNVDEELRNANNVISLLGGVLEKVDKFYLKDENNNLYEREIVIIRKKCSTIKIYPRQSNKIKKKPLN